VVLLSSLVFRDVTVSLGERFTTFRSFLCLAIEDEGTTIRRNVETSYPMTQCHVTQYSRPNSNVLCLQVSTALSTHHAAGRNMAGMRVCGDVALSLE
jgi:hypothetical protein